MCAPEKGMKPGLKASYKSAVDTVARSHSNFSSSFVVLSREKKLAFCAVYAFMRFCDDISDGETSNENKRELLARWRAQLDADETENSPDNSIMPAFRDTLQKFSIPKQYFHWIIDGTEMDLDVFRYETFEDLYKYCFNVASAVGLVCLQIFGFKDERAKKLAEQCGIAFQLTNILRDVKEDAERGRIYLPLEDLRKFDYSQEELQRGVLDERFRKLMNFETERAREYYRAARNLLPLVEKSSRPCLWAMIEIYERLLNRIIQSQFDVFSQRIRLSGQEKVTVALRALVMRIVGSGQ
jgi:15-cis-phytoene synthase